MTHFALKLEDVWRSIFPFITLYDAVKIRRLNGTLKKYVSRFPWRDDKCYVVCCPCDKSPKKMGKTSFHPGCLDYTDLLVCFPKVRKISILLCGMQELDEISCMLSKLFGTYKFLEHIKLEFVGFTEYLVDRILEELGKYKFPENSVSIFIDQTMYPWLFFSAFGEALHSFDTRHISYISPSTIKFRDPHMNNFSLLYHDLPCAGQITTFYSFFNNPCDEIVFEPINFFPKVKELYVICGAFGSLSKLNLAGLLKHEHIQKLNLYGPKPPTKQLEQINSHRSPEKQITVRMLTENDV